MAELSEQICALVAAETPGKCATPGVPDAAIFIPRQTARFTRVTLFDAKKKFRSDMRKYLLFFLSYGGQVLAANGATFDRCYQTHVKPGRSE